MDNFVVLDVETQLSAAEVGGWNNAGSMRVSVVVIYESKTDKFYSFTEENIAELWARLEAASCVVGFNIKKFDYAVLSPYHEKKGVFFKKLPTIDLLEEAHKTLGFRVSLDNVAGATLGVGKTASGLDALQWWKLGEVEKIEKYCTEDVRITKDVYLFWKKNNFVYFSDTGGRVEKINAVLPLIKQADMQLGLF